MIYLDNTCPLMTVGGLCTVVCYSKTEYEKYNISYDIHNILL